MDIASSQRAERVAKLIAAYAADDRGEFIQRHINWLYENFDRLAITAKAHGYTPSEFLAVLLESRLVADLCIVVGDLEMNLAEYSCARAGQPLDLTKTTFDMLRTFMLKPRTTLTRMYLTKEIWGYEGDAGRALDVRITILRRSVWGEDWRSSSPTRLVTQRGYGWMLVDNA